MLGQGIPVQPGMLVVHACRLKDGLKKYGKTGIYVYLGISFSITTGTVRYQ